MNREVKRMMKKREGAADRLKRPTPQQAAAKRKRTKPKDFVKEVRGELARVAWPNRQEVFTYTLVVVVSVTFFMILIWGLDVAFTKLGQADLWRLSRPHARQRPGRPGGKRHLDYGHRSDEHTNRRR